MATVDLLLILIVALIILLVWRGPTMLPQLGEALGKTVKSIRESVDRDATSPAAGVAPPVEAEDARPPAEAVEDTRRTGDDSPRDA